MLAPAVVAGLLAGLGLLVAVREFVPAHPHLGSALERLSGRPPAPPPVTGTGWVERVGRRVETLAEHRAFVRVPRQDLALVGVSTQAWFGHKALYALLGLAFPAASSAFVLLAGLTLPVAVPAVASVVLAAGLWFVPDLDVRVRAAAARVEFARAVTAYLDLTALERAAGSGASQALERAALVGDSWPFERLRTELHRARWAGAPPWQALATLAAELRVPELDDLADIMRLSGEEGAAVYETLRARARGLRTALLSREQARANADSERMVVPVALLGLIFLCLLAYPALVRVL